MSELSYRRQETDSLPIDLSGWQTVDPTSLRQGIYSYSRFPVSTLLVDH